MSGRRPPDSAILRYQRETADGTIHTYEPLVEERENSLAGVLEIESEVLRGVSLPSLLAGRARLFASEGQAARDDPSGTFALSKPVDSLSFFLSHSWRDDSEKKWKRMLEYKDEHSSSHGGEEPTCWLDKACIDQASDINQSLKVLPLFLLFSQRFVVFAGQSYTKRL